MTSLPPPDPNHPDPSVDALLVARVRSTSPGFERRFDDLRRRLAHGPSPRRRPRWLGPLFAHPVLWGAATMAGLVFTLSVVTVSNPRHRPSTADFAELLALDERLSDAVAITDPLTLEAVVLFTSEP
jgi:hypothetical protein